MSRSRWGGFRIGRRALSDWDTLKAPNAVVEEAPATVQDMDYTQAQGIWNLRSTTQFYKKNESTSLPANVLAYIPFDGTNGATSVDAYTQTGTLSAAMVGNGGSQLSNAQTKITGSTVSGYASASSTSSYWVSSSALTNLIKVGSASPLSIEFWWYNSGYITGNYARLISFGGYHDSGSGIEAEASNTSTTSYVFYEFTGGTTNRTNRGSKTIGTGWNHIYWAVDPTGGNSYIGINGSVSSYANYVSSISPASQNFALGGVDGANDDASRGYFQELIIRNAVPYTSNFTPSDTSLI